MNKTYDNTKKMIEFCEYAVHLMIHNLTVLLCINEYKNLMLFVKAVDHVTNKFLKTNMFNSICNIMITIVHKMLSMNNVYQHLLQCVNRLQHIVTQENLSYSMNIQNKNDTE